MSPTLLLLASLTLAAPQGDSYGEKIPEGMTEIKMLRVPDGKIVVDGKTIEVKGLYASQNEVTWDAFDVFTFFRDMSDEDRARGVDAKNRPSRPYGNYDRGFGHANYPAIGMHYHGAEMFCVWLSKKSGKKYRLPTEAEWEYIARAGATSDPSDLGEVAWYEPNSMDSTHEVGKKKPNAWGFYDVLGNASEWCKGMDGESITRGGAWMDPAKLVSTTARVPYSPSWQERDAQLPKSRWWLSDGPFVGLRIVCEP